MDGEGGGLWDRIQFGQPLIPFTPYERAIDQVVRLADGDVQASAEAAADVWGLSAVAIRIHCRGEFESQDFMYFAEWKQAGFPIRPREKARGEEKPIRCERTGERYSSISAAARALDRSVTAVSLAIHDRREIDGRTFVFEDEDDYEVGVSP